MFAFALPLTSQGVTTVTIVVTPIPLVSLDAVTCVPLPADGKSTSRNEFSPFGLLVGISDSVWSRMATVNASGATASTFEVETNWKLKTLPGVKVNWTS